jgi:GNAT superfamily N-acetyltransferase
VGFVSGLFDFERKVPVFYLFELMVIPEFQGKGLGGHLLNTFEAVAANALVSGTTLTCFTGALSR